MDAKQGISQINHSLNLSKMSTLVDADFTFLGKKGMGSQGGLQSQGLSWKGRKVILAS